MGSTIGKNGKVTINIPFSVLEVIDRIIEHRIGDNETSVSRTSVSLELLKLGARIEKKKLDNIETGANPFDSRHEEQLAYIARKIADVELKQRKLLRIIAKATDIDADFVKRVSDSVTMNDKDKTVLTRLFVEIVELKERLQEEA